MNLTLADLHSYVIKRLHAWVGFVEALNLKNYIMRGVRSLRRERLYTPRPPDPGFESNGLGMALLSGVINSEAPARFD